MPLRVCAGRRRYNMGEHGGASTRSARCSGTYFADALPQGKAAGGWARLHGHDLVLPVRHANDKPMLVDLTPASVVGRGERLRGDQTCDAFHGLRSLSLRLHVRGGGDQAPRGASRKPRASHLPGCRRARGAAAGESWDVRAGSTGSSWRRFLQGWKKAWRGKRVWGEGQGCTHPAVQAGEKARR